MNEQEKLAVKEARSFLNGSSGSRFELIYTKLDIIEQKLNKLLEGKQ